MPLPVSSSRDPLPAGSSGHHRRHQPETTLLYRIVEQHYPAFLAHLQVEGRSLPDYVQQEFADFLKCGRLEHGFRRTPPPTVEQLHDLLYVISQRVARYIARPAISEQRLSLTPTGKVRYQLKTPFRNGTTHVIFEPLDFIARLAALVPKPRANLTRFHGVFAPNSKHRALITPSGRGKGNSNNKHPAHPDDKSPAERHAAMTWAQRLKRVFNIDIEICEKCQGPVRIIACIEDPATIRKILEHLKNKESADSQIQLPHEPAPPQIGLFDEA